MKSPVLQEIPQTASPGVTPVCHPATPADAPQRRWRASGVPCITQYTPSGTYFVVAKVRKRQHRINLGQNLKAAKREFRSWKATLRIHAPARRVDKATPRSWEHFAGRYCQEVQSRVDLAEPSKAYLMQRLKALEATWPDAQAYKLAETKPKPRLGGMDVTALTKEALATWAASYARSYSHTAYNNTVTVLPSILQMAVDGGILPVNPAAQLVRLGEPERLIKGLPSPAQWDNIIAEMGTGGSRTCEGQCLSGYCTEL